jgi:hypothetical protein
LNRGIPRRSRQPTILVCSACFILAGVLLLLFPLESFGYAILAHQAIIDVVWASQLKPLLHRKYPQATDGELNAAEAYAYGGSIIQDLGYYPYGSPFFSDLTHYVRSGDFISAMLRNSHDVYDYAFALGALAHRATDMDGHQIATNRSVPLLYPKLQKKFGDEITYEDDPLAHVKTEFGFDVLQIARGHYAPEDFHDYIGFEVSQPLLDQAFQETYGLELKYVLTDEEKALNSYRRDVSKLIPKATRIAWSLKREEIRAAEPGTTHRKFLYNLSRANYEKEWGSNYTRPNFSDRFLAFVYKLLPKFGPLKVLQFRMPTPETEKLFEASFNSSFENYRNMLVQVREEELKLPNTNFDVGSKTVPGKYRLSDYAHARLLHELAKQKFQGATPEIRSEILEFFASPDALEDLKKDAKTWERVQGELEQLRQLQASAAQPIQAMQHVPAGCVPNVTLR